MRTWKSFQLLATLLLAASPAADAAITTTFNAGQLVVTSVDEAGVALACAGGNVTVNGSVPGDAGAVACSAVTGVVVNGNTLDNTITLAAMTAADFSQLAQVTVNGGEGADNIIGSFQADALNGEDGNDTLDGHDNPLSTTDTISGGDGDDVMIWNPGKDDDVNIGGPGNDTTLIVGGGAAEVFAITANGATVRFERTLANGAPAAFFVDITETELLRVNANAGSDSLTAATLPAGLITLEVNGGDGDDTLVGSDGADLLRGDGGNDALDGDDNPPATTDNVAGGDGDDVMTWNPGKDDDVNIGGAGNDTAVIVGGGAAEVFAITANGGTVHFERTLSNGAPAAFFVDITETELLRVNANAGNDSLNAATLPAGLLTLEVNGGDGDDTLVGSDGADLLRGDLGNDALDGDDNPPATTDNVAGGDGDDVMIWNPGKDDDLNIGGAGNDTAVIVGGGAAEVFNITTNGGGVRLQRVAPAFFVDISQTELLRVEGNAGDDTIDATGLGTGLIALELNGGDGNDSIVGGPDADLIHGGNSNDTLRAGENPVVTPDQVFGDAGDDVLIWNAGDDNDVNEGGDGNDTVLVNAAGADESFEIAASGARVLLTRTLPSVFTLDNAAIESLQLNAGGGDDVVATQLFPSLAQVLDGGASSTAAGDRLTVSGFAGEASVSPILKPGFAPIQHSGFERAQAIRSGGTFSARLEGAQEVPPVATAATGRGTVTLNAAENEITVSLSFSGLGSNSTMAHIHGPAAVGANASPIFNLTGVGATSGTLGPFVFAVTPAQMQDLKAGLWYFNVHSVDRPGGEIRGQIFADVVLEAIVEQRQVVPPSLSSARGYATATLAGAADQVVFTLVYGGLVGEGAPGVSTAVRVRGPAGRGGVGPVIDGIVLPVSGQASDAFTSAPFALSPQQVDELRRGVWYIEVVSQEFPAGEIRGQFTQSLFFDNFD